jgi:hypothetical protein
MSYDRGPVLARRASSYLECVTHPFAPSQPREGKPRGVELSVYVLSSIHFWESATCGAAAEHSNAIGRASDSESHSTHLCPICALRHSRLFGFVPFRSIADHVIKLQGDK